MKKEQLKNRNIKSSILPKISTRLFVLLAFNLSGGGEGGEEIQLDFINLLTAFLQIVLYMQLANIFHQW